MSVRSPLMSANPTHARLYEVASNGARMIGLSTVPFVAATSADLDRAFLIATDHVRDARRIEREFLTTFAERRSPAPLVVPDAAAGYTEWHRGAYADAVAMAESIAAKDGFILHAPLRAWLRDVFVERGALLFAWSSKMLEAIEYERHNGPPSPRPRAIERALRDALDCFVALDIEIEPLAPEPVLDWYRNR